MNVTRFSISFSILGFLVLPQVVSAQSNKAGNAGAAKAEVREAITADLRQIDAPGLPGVISSFLDRSFVVVAGRSGDMLNPVIAAGEMPGLKKGRIVAFGHDGYLDANSFKVADTGQLALRLARWATHQPVVVQGKSSVRKSLALVGRQNLAPFFQEAGWNVTPLGGDWAEKLKGANLVVLSAGDVHNAQQVSALRKHLANGGGMMFGITGWGWEQVHPGKTLARDFVLTPLLMEAGLAVSNATADPTDGKFMAVKPLNDLALLNSSVALECLKAIAKSKNQSNTADLKQLGATLLTGLRAVPADEPVFRKELTGFLSKHKRRKISAATPVEQGEIMDRLAIQLDHEQDRLTPAASVKANLSVADFPGAVRKDAKKINKTVRFTEGSHGRLGTGLYAPAGSVVRVKVLSGELPPNSLIRIGAHSDTTWHLNRWERHPEISRTWRMDGSSKETPVASAFGGLIYLEPGRPLKGKVELELEGVVASPLFVLGETTVADWQKLKQAAAPWAELRSKHVGLVLPSDSVRALEDPTALLRLWDKVMETQDELGPLNREYIPTQWIVPDRQISAGYMHSGNPIMTFMDVVPYFSSAEKLMKSDPGGVSWGILHEIGHNRQRGDWTPSGLGEVTNNLFALYVYDKMLGRPSFGHPGLLTGEKRSAALAKYRETGPDFEKFKGDPFLALSFFMELQESFGWKPLIEFFADSEAKPSAERPKTDVQRWDAWLTGMSKRTGKNLGPYFQLWGITVSKEALESVQTYPAWRPGTKIMGE